MRILSAALLLPLAACSLTVGPANTAQANNAALGNTAAPVDAAAPANAIQADKIGSGTNMGAPANASASAQEGGTGGRELPEEAANLDFVALNRTGRNILTLNISPAGEESWGDDLLTARTLPANERAAIIYTRDYEVCAWDVRVTFEGGGQQSWPRVNLCDTVRVELR